MVALAEPLVALGVLLAFLAFICAEYGYSYTIGAVIRGVITALDKVGVNTPVGRLSLASAAAPLAAVDNAIRHGLGLGVQSTQWAWHRLWHWTAYAVQHPGQVLGDVAEQTLAAFQTLRRHTIPTLLTVALGPIAGLAYSARDRIAGIAKDVATLAAHPLRLLHQLAARLEALTSRVDRVVTHTITQVVTKAVAVPGAAVGRLELEVGALRKWVRDHAGTVVGVTAGTVAAVALGRLGLGWTKCAKVTRLGKRLCGMDENLLEDVLAGTLAITGTVSLVELARDMQAITPEVTDAVRWFVRAA